MDTRELYRNSRPATASEKMRAAFRHFLTYGKQEPQPALAADLTAFVADILTAINHPQAPMLRAEAERWEREALEMAQLRRRGPRTKVNEPIITVVEPGTLIDAVPAKKKKTAAAR